MRVKLEIPLKLTEIADMLNSAKAPPSNKHIKYISTDTRELYRGDLFIPLCGKNYDGECFADEALKRGAYVISKRHIEGHISTENPGMALLTIAKRYKEKLPSLKSTVAVTGSVGKSTTKEMLYQLIKKSFVAHKTQGNFNNEVGLPLSILSAPQNCEMLILEMGMNHSGEISVLSQCARPNIALITNVGTAHIGNLGSRESIANEKASISAGMNKDGIVLCEYEEPLLEKINNRRTVSSISDKADVFLTRIRRSYDGTRFDLIYNGQLTRNMFVPLWDDYMLKNAFMAIGAAIMISMPMDAIREGCLGFYDGCGRSKILPLGSIYVLDDTYNSSPESAEASLMKLKRCGKKRYSALLGDMLELGEKSEDLHRRVGAAAARCGISTLFLIGDFCDSYKAGALSAGFDSRNIFLNYDKDDPRKTASQILNCTQEGEMILFKASHNIMLSRVIDAMREMKGQKND